MEPKVFIRPVGEVNWQEIKGVTKIDGIQNEPEQGKSKLAEPRTWSAKVRQKCARVNKMHGRFAYVGKKQYLCSRNG